jgi:glycosyltransferase involved in cell wall biosynthesis
MPRILFVLRHRDAPWGHDGFYHGYHLSSGLRNSVRFIIELLVSLGIEAKMVEVVDNNSIDREVTLFKPTHVIIEAFWVIPTKFDVLIRRHPNVTWMVRNHSETPFLANEGQTFAWIAQYLARGVEVTCNAPRSVVDLDAYAQALGHGGLVSYSPNYYPLPADWHPRPHHPHADDTVRIGCFGAIRPLKNHMVQALAAIRYADTLGKKLDFFINATRIEGGGNPILNNLRGLFDATPRAKLIEVGWLEHHEFLELLRHRIDMVLQVSFSETFNIVSADAVLCSCPVVASREVSWLQPYAVADPSSTTSVLQRMLQVRQQHQHHRLAWQFRDLTKFNESSRAIWRARFLEHHAVSDLVHAGDRAGGRTR